jgi:prepilin-type N-terminal cleavage/methylation domain-containing protein
MASIPVCATRYGAQATRRGFSLFEMLLVLAILAVAAAVVWPSLAGLYADSQLRNGADQVRTGLLQARLRAIEGGVVHHFRYALGDRFYQITTSDGSRAQDSTQNGREEQTVFALSTGLRFFADSSDVTASRSRAAPAMSDGATVADAPVAGGESALPGANWSGPIVFRPDGTADDASLVVASEDGSYVSLSVRSITGVVDVSTVQRVR